MSASQPRARRAARHAGGLPTGKGRPISTVPGAGTRLVDGGGRCGVRVRRSRRDRARHRRRHLLRHVDNFMRQPLDPV